MVQHNSQQKDKPNGLGHVRSSLTLPLPSQINNQQQQLAIHANYNNIIVRAVSSQPSSLASSGSSSSMQSRSPEVKDADELFDRIEDMICEYMRDPSRNHFDSRVLGWYLDDNESRLFSVVILIKPPTNEK